MQLWPSQLFKSDSDFCTFTYGLCHLHRDFIIPVAFFTNNYLFWYTLQHLLISPCEINEVKSSLASKMNCILTRVIFGVVKCLKRLLDLILFQYEKDSRKWSVLRGMERWQKILCSPNMCNVIMIKKSRIVLTVIDSHKRHIRIIYYFLLTVWALERNSWCNASVGCMMKTIYF